MSQTYVQFTHHHMEKLSQTNPKNIGINFIPFPNSSICPETSLLLADEVPRCSGCSAFFNKFNKYNSKEFRCSLCGKINKFKIQNTYSDINSNTNDQSIYVPSFNGCTNFGGINNSESVAANSPECKYEVYEAVTKYKFHIRRNSFVPTTYFYISLSLMKTHPDIVNCIDQYLQECYKARQIGICFLHGALTLVKLRPSVEFQTYFDDAPQCRSPLYYVSSSSFRMNFQTIINKAAELNYVEAAYDDNYCENVIEHSKKMTMSFGTNVFYILDEKDFILFSSEKNRNLIISSALEMLKTNVQVSINVFASQNRISIEQHNPLFNFAAITGGAFKIYPQSALILGQNQISNNSNNINNMYNDFLKVLNYPCLDDTFIFVCPPENVPLNDFAGQGMMKSHTGISISKIKLNDIFSFTFDPSDCDDFPYIQFVTYYTTPDNIRKMRVVTAPILKYKPIDIIAQSIYCSNFVSQRFLIEGKEKALKVLETFKKQFKGISYTIPEFIVENTNYLQSSLCSLMSFNKSLYEITDDLKYQYQQQNMQNSQPIFSYYAQQQQQQAQQFNQIQYQQQFGQQVLLQNQYQQSGQQFVLQNQQQLFSQPYMQQQLLHQQVLLQNQAQQYQQQMQQYQQQLPQAQYQFQQELEQQQNQQPQFEQKVLQQQQFQQHLQQIQIQQQQFEQSLQQQSPQQQDEQQNNQPQNEENQIQNEVQTEQPKQDEPNSHKKNYSIV